MHEEMTDLLSLALLFAGLAILPLYLDSWFMDRDEFEMRKAVYAKKRWQVFIINNRNPGRYASLALLFTIAIVSRLDFVRTSDVLVFMVSVLAAVCFASFLVFQLSHLVVR